MRLLKFAVVGFCLVGLSAFGQETTQSPEERVEKKINKLDEQVDLTDKQREQIEALAADLLESSRKIKMDESISEEDKESQLKELRKAHKEAVKEILTEEQVAKLKEIREENREAKQRQTLEEKVRAKTDRMKEHLALTDDQESKVYDLNLKVAEKIQAIKLNPEMSDERKKEFIKGNKQDYKNALSTILTEEQMKKFEEMRAKKKAHHEEHEEMEEQSEE